MSSERPRPAGTSPARQLSQRIDKRTAQLGVVGLGYVGLPLAVEFGKAGFRVTGIDIDEKRVRELERGISYIPDVPTADVKELVKSGKLQATTDFAALKRMDAVNICVPTPLSKQRDPDVSYIVAATEQLAKHLHRGMLVILESTTYPGTTEELILPRLQETGLKVGRDFFLAFSPERVDPGNARFNTRNIPKVVGGVTATCRDMAVRLYRQRLERVVPVSSPQVAEMVKLLENTFRSVNIGLVNELALMCARLKIDVWEVIDAAATKPFGFMPFFPGPGLGGHCVDGNEFVFVRRDGGIDAVRMKELAEHSKRRRSIGDTEVMPLDPVEVLSFDLEAKKTCFRPATHLFRRWYPRRVTLRSAEGRSLTATDGHPMIVQNGHGLEVRRADAVDAESRLVVAVDIPEGNPPTSIDLVESLGLNSKSRVRVKPKSGSWLDHWDQICSIARKFGVEKKQLRRSDTIPLGAYLELEVLGFAGFSRADLLLATGRGSGHGLVPMTLPIGRDLARIVGYYLSEGCLTRDKSWRTRWTFGSHELELIEDLTGTLDRLGFRWSIHRVKRWKAVQIKVSSNLLGRLIGESLGCGRRSEEMRIPPVFLGADEGVRRTLLGALLNGDGSVDATTGERTYRKNGKTYRHRNNSACASYFTSSPKLLQQVTLLMHSLSLVPSIKSGKPELRLFGEEQLRSLAPLFLGAKREKLMRYLRNRSKPMKGRRVRRDGEFATLGSKDVVPAGGGWVYSIEVPGTQTYVTSYGLVSHNCIPIDPFYLSWKARASGFEARFIELAGTVNGQMPDHVVRLVAECLNHSGRSIRGSKILVLGVAYKADIDDTRESPSLDIMEKLRERGATIDYSDPYVPSLEFAGKTLKSTELTPARLARFDCVVIATAHKTFKWDEVLRSSRAVVDTRYALRGRRSKKIVRL
jgi:UDP-N-acetyl-D-mannosaminuronate dehydrogenase/intein/homing endonuclease